MAHGWLSKLVISDLFKATNFTNDTNTNVSVSVVEEKSENNRIEPMPTIETDWKPGIKSVNDYLENKERNKAMKAQLVDVELSTVDNTATIIFDQATSDQLVEQQYKIEELERTATLWKDRSKEADKRFFDLSEENRKLDKDFRDLYRENQRLQDMLDNSKRVRLLNYLLMKENTDLIDQAEIVAEEKEVDNTWR